MSVTLQVAAGGGGDALAALMIGRTLDPGSAHDQVVASYSWDRYIIDPTPGPRRVSDFTGLARRAEHVWEVTPQSQLLTGGRSGLTILAQQTDARFFLLDPFDGAAGLRKQIEALACYISAASVVLTDVGGDIAAKGDEPELSSPLADSLVLSAVAGLPGQATVVVAGPGLDGELPQTVVRAYMEDAGARHSRVASGDAKNFRAALDRHPSEATALLAAAAIGIEGEAEIRDSAALVPLDAASADLLVADCHRVNSVSRVAQAVASSRTFEEAEQLTREVCRKTELDHERTKAAALLRTPYDKPDVHEIRSRIAAHRTKAAARGATLISLRRLTEIGGLRTYDPELIRRIVGSLAYDDVPLCRV
ncbi:DUF1152 domain-containing protein [Paractinoplanes globisporus]|uniref:DUF1152 domain-containing protein n=1 Tax=Paractinoplanes globisporus TaxID=113565 RepID=A0ABW6WK99_9ACTN|nr:DUF1152 domain-containing protein [Actinoplanes globisporus]